MHSAITMNNLRFLHNEWVASGRWIHASLPASVCGLTRYWSWSSGVRWGSKNGHCVCRGQVGHGQMGSCIRTAQLVYSVRMDVGSICDSRLPAGVGTHTLFREGSHTEVVSQGNERHCSRPLVFFCLMLLHTLSLYSTIKSTIQKLSVYYQNYTT